MVLFWMVLDVPCMLYISHLLRGFASTFGRLILEIDLPKEGFLEEGKKSFRLSECWLYAFFTSYIF